MNQGVLGDFNIGSVHIVQVFLWGKTFSCVEEVELSTSVLWERISGGKFFVALYASIAAGVSVCLGSSMLVKLVTDVLTLDGYYFLMSLAGV